jgi:hypothetical protein
MAALRAKIIQRMTNIKFINKNERGYIVVCHPGTTDTTIPGLRNARKNPIIANGIAKMVWENFIKLK